MEKKADSAQGSEFGDILNQFCQRLGQAASWLVPWARWRRWRCPRPRRWLRSCACHASLALTPLPSTRGARAPLAGRSKIGGVLHAHQLRRKGQHDGGFHVAGVYAKAVLVLTERARTASGIGIWYQLHVTTVSPHSVRSMRGRVGEAGLPAVAVEQQQLAQAAARTPCPSCCHSANTVLGCSDRVPANAPCSGLKPMNCTGSTGVGSSGEQQRWGTLEHGLNQEGVHAGGRCGPCCSTAATGNTATARAAWLLWRGCQSLGWSTRPRRGGRWCSRGLSL